MSSSRSDALLPPSIVPAIQRSMADLIEEGEWGLAMEYCQTHLEEMADIDQSTGMTILHRLCSKPNAPIDLLENVLKAFPEAVRIQEKVYQATPLHTLCWTAQRSTAKVSLLLRNASEMNHLNLRNQFGGTVLHSACGSQASIDVIQTIIEACPTLVLSRSSNGYQETPLTALWHSHLQSIPGHMEIASILNRKIQKRKKKMKVDESHKTDDEDDVGNQTSDHFDRFWEKVIFLARVAFFQQSSLSSSASMLQQQKQEDDDDIEIATTSNPIMIPQPIFDDGSLYGLHGLFLLRAPINAIKVAILLHPEWVEIPDEEGNYPLHVIILRRPFRLKDGEIIQMLLETFPQAAGLQNKAGDTPIVLALRGRMNWEDGLNSIVRANPGLLGTRDPHTGLYPFLLAASLGGAVAINTSYQLLCEQPDLLVEAALVRG